MSTINITTHSSANSYRVYKKKVIYINLKENYQTYEDVFSHTNDNFTKCSLKLKKNMNIYINESNKVFKRRSKTI